VVLTLHNASLGASTGWGIPSFAQQIKEHLAQPFMEKVSSLCRRFMAMLSANPLIPDREADLSLQVQTARLFHLWDRRLANPLLSQNLWALKASLLLNDLPLEEWERQCDWVKGIPVDSNPKNLHQTAGLSLTFLPPENLSRRMQEIVSWQEQKRNDHPTLLALLWSLLAVGTEWLEKDHLPFFILPIIDKFFASSQRDQDLEYLPLFVRLAGWMGHAPLFLFIDDTSRARQPSLQLALQHWRQRYPFLGLGVFGDGSDPEISPLETIVTRTSEIHLFALRPLTQVHNPYSLDNLLQQRPRFFLTPSGYDSSWKDNLPFLYQGTQVAPLAGPEDQPEKFSPSLLTSAGPMAFGAYYRCKLRQLTLEKLGFIAESMTSARNRRSALDDLWQKYGFLANLF
jgi:hypothetical protein